MGAQKNRLIETVLLSTHNVCFGWEIRKMIFQIAPRKKLLLTQLLKAFYKDLFSISAIYLLQHIKHVEAETRG